MAKWGEGDPRWIVEERPDATNVNNWHWTEKNASFWSQNLLKELLNDLTIEGEVGRCKITEITKVSGEAVANNRKGKLIFFYEWEITLKWKGQHKDSDTEIEGTAEIPNLSEENDPCEVDVNISVTTTDDFSQQLKDMMRTVGIQNIREKLAEYIKRLKDEFSQGMILPTKEQAKTTSNVLKVTPTKQVYATSENLERKGMRLDLTELNMTESFKCKAEEFFRALTIKEMVQAFTQGPCQLELTEGGKFSLFDGNVHGIFVELIPNKKIVQKWRFKTWPSGHYSDVTLEITEKEDSTEVKLTQKGVPRNELEQTREGWKNYYWQSMKRVFGFGAMLI
ncbi:activator of 90 kDa heat shock protein ATPase homolog 1-like [Limulus polyphemus]|uniref:Activator of 90 kDa heat shock protein ATPase homolog 1-like n=1 Tax=Limulus polyphemus TaxID=6850 RepID=A0ABM1B3K3_LIMPO|nr:activator of 90 kDa heat shock protein ATPase homolog 1-like [Limulus polyphemus]